MAEFFENKRNRVIAQIIFWTSILGSMNLMLTGTNAPLHFYYINYIRIIASIIIVSLNAYLFVPYFFTKKRYGSYVLATFLGLIFFITLTFSFENILLQDTKVPFPKAKVRRFLKKKTAPYSDINLNERFLRPPRLMRPKYFITFIIYTAILLVGTLLESVQLYRKQERQASLAQNEKLETELKFLKSQINPHFLFNVLNNVYTLSLIQSEQTSDVVMKLSEMLRYMLYESNQDRVSLGQEITYINNYISLQLLKDDIPLGVDINIEVENNNVKIAPMILIPFVENAFKHSKIEDTKNGWIKIYLQENGKEIHFCVSNSIAKHHFIKDATGGIGLKNVCRRMELEYPDKHYLNIVQDDSQFNVQLSIQPS
ncbi:MAG: histidine kinase [Chitinophagales bacterium]|nr:histidine kinase [Chitinophagales bacterium]